MEHTTSATVVAVSSVAAGAGIAAVSIFTGTAIAPAFLLAFIIVTIGAFTAIGIVERGRSGYGQAPAQRPQVVADADAA